MKHFYTSVLTALFIFFVSFTVTSPVHANDEVVINNYAQSSSGEDWSYDASSKTLTLSGYRLTMEETSYPWFDLSGVPEGFTIHLADGTTNEIEVFSVYSAQQGGIIRVTGNGELKCDHMWMEMQVDSGSVSANIYHGDALIINGGTVKLDSTKALDDVRISGGDVTINEFDVYRLEITGGTVKTNALSNCNGDYVEVASFILTGGSLAINVVDPAKWNGLVFYAPKDSIGLAQHTQKINALLQKFGMLTDGNGNPLYYSIEEGGIYRVTFVDEDGNTAKNILILPNKHPFTDVAADSYYVDPVIWAVEEGITKGTSATTFSPGRTCTRGEIVTFLYRAAGSSTVFSEEHPFTDVDENQYYYKAMLWAVEKGITQGTSATTFSPGRTCTRGEIVTFLHRAFDKAASNTEEHPFTDVDANQYYYEAMLWAVENGITQGASATTFAPGRTCIRAEIVTFLYRAFN